MEACRPWISSSVTTETGASASMARSSVFEAATVMVSSDCTGARPICALAFRTAADGACACAALRLRFAFRLLSACSVPPCDPRRHPRVCAEGRWRTQQRNESTDAPKIKARECLTPIAMCPNLSLLLGFGWRALQRPAAAGWLTMFTMQAPRSHRRPLLVKSRHRNGQSPQAALYIDCKLRRLDCAAIEPIQSFIVRNV